MRVDQPLPRIRVHKANCRWFCDKLRLRLQQLLRLSFRECECCFRSFRQPLKLCRYYVIPSSANHSFVTLAIKFSMRQDIAFCLTAVCGKVVSLTRVPCQVCQVISRQKIKFPAWGVIVSVVSLADSEPVCESCANPNTQILASTQQYELARKSNRIAEATTQRHKPER